MRRSHTPDAAAADSTQYAAGAAGVAGAAPTTATAPAPAPAAPGPQPLRTTFAFELPVAAREPGDGSEPPPALPTGSS